MHIVSVHTGKISIQFGTRALDHVTVTCVV